MLRTVIERPVSVAVATVTLVVLGFFSLLNLPVSLLPTLERPRLVVTVRAPEASREMLVHEVARPLERRLQSLDGVVETRAVIDDGECVVTLETEWQTDVDSLRIQAERRLADAAGPAGGEMVVRTEAGDREPILSVAVRGGRSDAARAAFADKVLIPELGRLPGAGRLVRLGGASRRAVVRPDAAALAARGLTVRDLVDRLERVGDSRPLGRARDGARIRSLTVNEPVRSLAELSARRLGGEPGVALGEVARVAIEEVPDAGFFRLDGESAVLVEVHRAPGANAVLLARAARRVVAELAGRAGGGGAGGPRLEVVGDASLEVVGALRQLGWAALLGLVLGTVVLRFMLGGWRPTLALAVAVPASLVTAFGAFYLWGVSLDVVSLAGLALAAGMLVDNSIVVLEAIESARSRPAEDPLAEGGEAPEVAGTRGIALALVASFLTTAVVFLPLTFLQGLARAFFGVQAFAIVSSLAVSLVLSLTLTPVLARRRSAAARPRSPGRRLYLALLDRALERPAGVLVITLAVLGAAAWLASRLPAELLPRGPSRALSAALGLPAGTTAGEASERLDRLTDLVAGLAEPPRRVLALLPGVDGAPRRAGGETLDRGGELVLHFADAESRRRAQATLAPRLLRQPGMAVELRAVRGALASAVDRSTGGLELELSALNEARVERLAATVSEHLAKAYPGVEIRRASVTGTGDGGGARPAYELRWDAYRLSHLAADPARLAGEVSAALGGFYAGQVDVEEVEPEILIEAVRPFDARLVPVRAGGEAADGGSGTTLDGTDRSVPLGAVAALERRRLAPRLERRNGRPAARLTIPSSVPAAGLETFVEALPRAVDEKVELGGRQHELRRSFGQLRLALGLAIVLVFLTVAALYESFAMPLVVMITVPLAAAGGVAALWLGSASLNVMSLLGFVLLAGIVVNNAIVLVHRVEQLRAGGRPGSRALREAAAERYRPILMTILTTLLGLVPLVALGGEGAELRSALALAVSGGLVTAFLGTLFVVPILHRVLVIGRTR